MVNGKCVSVYVHFDGYETARIPLLLEHYNSQELAEGIVALGSISSLNERLAPNEGEEHSFDNRIDDITVAYHRDRGEDFKQYKIGETKDDCFGEEYSYHFENGEWWYRNNYHPTEAEWVKCSEWWSGYQGSKEE
jgi:hypothetical protein